MYKLKASTPALMAIRAVSSSVLMLPSGDASLLFVSRT